MSNCRAWVSKSALYGFLFCGVATLRAGDCFAGVIAGRVVGADGQAIGNAVVELHIWEWKWPKPPTKVKSANDGSFRFDDLDGRTYRVLTEVAGCVLAMQHLVLDSGETKQVELRVVPSTCLQVIVVDPHGRPLSGARLTELTMQVEGNGKHWIGMKDFDRFHVPRAVSDASGVLVLPSMAKGTRATIVVDHPKFAPTELADFLVQVDEPGQVSLKDGAAALVHLIPSKDLGRPLDGTEFCVEMSCGTQDRCVSLNSVLFVAKNNGFEFRVNPARYGIFEVRAVNAFVTPVFRSDSGLLIVPESLNEYSLLVRPAIAVRGRLVAKDAGVPVASLQVWGETQNLNPAGEVVGDRHSDRWVDCKWGDSNSQGDYVLYLPPGLARVQVDAEGLATQRAFYVIDVLSGVENRIPDIVVGRSPLISGRVVGEDGNACAGAVVRVVGKGDLITRADENGQFQLRLPSVPFNWRTEEREREQRVLAYMPRDCRAGVVTARIEGDSESLPVVIKLRECKPEWVLETLESQIRPSPFGQSANVVASPPALCLENVKDAAPQLNCQKWLNTEHVEKDLANFRGKYVLLDFWAIWCGACHSDFPSVKLMHELFTEELVVIGVHDNSEPVERIQAHVRDLGLRFPIAIDNADGRTLKAYAGIGVAGYPNYVLIDPDGNIAACNGANETRLRFFKLELFRQILLQSANE